MAARNQTRKKAPAKKTAPRPLVPGSPRARPAPATATVPREFYDDAIRQRDVALLRGDRAEERLAKVVDELAALKRHDVGATPTGGAESYDPMDSLGSRTQLAIEEFAQGDPELRNRLILTAQGLTAQRRAEAPDAGEGAHDQYVATLIRNGEG